MAAEALVKMTVKAAKVWRGGMTPEQADCSRTRAKCRVELQLAGCRAPHFRSISSQTHAEPAYRYTIDTHMRLGDNSGGGIARRECPRDRTRCDLAAFAASGRSPSGPGVSAHELTHRLRRTPPAGAMPILPTCSERPGSVDIHTLGTVSLDAQAAFAPCAAERCQCNYNLTMLRNASDLLRNNASCAPTSRSPAPTLLGAFSLENVCVRYPKRGLAVADFISRNGTCADIWGYSEYSKTYRRIANIRPQKVGDDLAACQQHRLGLGIRYSSNNFYHQLNFVASAHSALHRFAAPDAIFVPIGSGFPTTRPDNLWEYTLRGLSSLPAAELRNQTHTLLKASCTCFDRLVAATHAFQPAKAGSRPAFSAFRHSSAINARAALMMRNVEQEARRHAQDMLFIVRHGSRRVISNEADMRARLLADQPRVRFVSFEELPIVRQLALVSESSVLIGVHGMAIAGYLVHLPSDRRRTACVEIRPAVDPRSWEWRAIVADLAHGAGVQFFALDAPHAPGCYIDQMRHTNCSSEADREAIDASSREVCEVKIRKGMRSFQAASVLNCNITVSIASLLYQIRSAAAYTV